jgi:hypothetical protein
VNGDDANPGTLNAWLRVNGGYVGHNDLEETVITDLNSGVVFQDPILSQTGLTPDQIREVLEDPHQVIIGNVRKGRHFVLLTGYDNQNSTMFYVNDPGFNVLTYDYADFVGYRLFTLNL